MLVFLLANAAYSAIFGIDWGNEYIKTAMAIAGKSVHVVLNQNGKRLAPAYFAFWKTDQPRNSTPSGDHWNNSELTDYSWSFLDAAKSHSMRFPNNTIKGISPLLGAEHGFTRRESFAITLRHLVKSIDEGKWRPDAAKIVYGVEPFMTRQERYALLEATWLSNGTCTAIIDSPTASANLYALEKRGSYAKKAKTILFIDVGATNTWAAVFKFEPSKNKPVVTELSLVTRAGFGGNIMDQRLSELLLNKYAQSNSIPVPTDARIKRRFLEEARKTKELLSLNKEVDARIEDVEDDKMLNEVITIEEFEGLLGDFDETLAAIYDEALTKAGITKEQIDGVELIGGTTRVPYIQQVLLRQSGLKKLNRTMNSDEAVALGAGYVGATQSAIFIVKKVRHVSPCHTVVSITHGEKNIRIFNETSSLTNSYKYMFRAHENGNITIFAGTPAVPMTTFMVDLPNNTKPDARIQVNFGFDDFTIPNVTIVKLNGDELNISEDVKFYRPDWALSEEGFNKSFEFVMKMESIVDDRKKFQETYNDYESYIYQIKDKLMYDTDFQTVCNESETERVQRIADENRKWLDEHMNNVTTEELKKQHDAMKDELRDTERRVEHLQSINESMANMDKTLERMYKEMTEVWPKKKKWMSKDTLKKAWQNYNHTSGWYKKKMAKNANIPPYLNPDTWYNQVNVQRQIMEFNFNSTNRQKKPLPTPTPTPTPVGWTPTPEPAEPDFSDDAEFESWLSMRHPDDEDYVEHLMDRHHDEPDDDHDYMEFLREMHPDPETFFDRLKKIHTADVEYLDYLKTAHPSKHRLIAHLLKRKHKGEDDPIYIDFLKSVHPDSTELQDVLNRTKEADMKYITYLREKHDRDPDYIDHLLRRKKDDPKESHWREFLDQFPQYDENRTVDATPAPEPVTPESKPVASEDEPVADRPVDEPPHMPEEPLHSESHDAPEDAPVSARDEEEGDDAREL